MAATTILLALGIGLFAGVLSGIFGIGGGVVMVPAMVLLLGYGQKTATGTSLGALILPVAALAVFAYHRAGYVEIRTSLLLAAGIFAGSLVGAKIALGTSDQLLRRLFAVLLVAMAIRLVLTTS
ncbi:MAG TPA: sulfite exporter TauE/SafE family protein [Mycobacteriales bacterium]|nr:sulfite exporter TauE/SafE family protein [Mycobacteriales bacterium]